MNALSKTLRAKREESGFTQTQVAKLIDVSLRTYMYYENDVWPSHENLIKLNKLFDYDF